MNKKTVAAIAALNAIALKYSILDGDLMKMNRAIQTLKAASEEKDRLKNMIDDYKELEKASTNSVSFEDHRYSERSEDFV